MPIRNRTYRLLDDGERIEGTWRHIFIKNGRTYFLTDLKVYADGLVDCWGLVDIEGFREKVRQGWVATTLIENGEVSAHHLGRWRFADPESITAELLVSEVEDTIAELQGKPSSSERFGEVLETFLADTSEENRTLLRDAYYSVPAHLRMYVLGDQDMADWPVKVLVGELGEPVVPRSPPFEPRPITEEDRRRALDYFSATRERVADWRARTNDNDPDGPPAGAKPASVGEGGTRYVKGGGWVDMAGDGYLSNDVPTEVVVKGIEYRSVTHAYWSVSTSDPAMAERIRLAPRATDATQLGIEATRKTGWSGVRLAVMTDLVRAKFDQHPELAERLLATGEARIRSPFSSSGSYWQAGAQGRNWLGRILELVRSELRLRELDSIAPG
jgi:predicted NAD-dependent protein-ADP-ribosyltransferase YbiA (DUF1768 family)